MSFEIKKICPLYHQGSREIGWYKKRPNTISISVCDWASTNSYASWYCVRPVDYEECCNYIEYKKYEEEMNKMSNS